MNEHSLDVMSDLIEATTELINQSSFLLAQVLQSENISDECEQELAGLIQAFDAVTGATERIASKIIPADEEPGSFSVTRIMEDIQAARER